VSKYIYVTACDSPDVVSEAFSKRSDAQKACDSPEEKWTKWVPGHLVVASDPPNWVPTYKNGIHVDNTESDFEWPVVTKLEVK